MKGGQTDQLDQALTQLQQALRLLESSVKLQFQTTLTMNRLATEANQSPAMAQALEQTIKDLLVQHILETPIQKPCASDSANDECASSPTYSENHSPSDCRPYTHQSIGKPVKCPLPIQGRKE